MGFPWEVAGADAVAAAGTILEPLAGTAISVRLETILSPEVSPPMDYGRCRRHRSIEERAFSSGHEA